ncbi:hypothetical protein OS493_007726 [Desmophyllum pertusum]|uniref:Uncharacterized protein n=1 Tax=Desmophyllum pertusum TaxID=174260 RepID=A0A9W9YRV7_9CNID|nr:hypothetical protein OS493_007726 [Desmophyllum pertusum]
MIWQTVPTLVLGVLALVTISEAANTTVTSTNSTTECVPADRTKRSAVQPESGVCLPYQALFRTGYHGYCEDIIGYLPVYGSNKNELYENEMKMYRYRAMKTFLEQTRQNSTDNSYVVRQSCLDMVDYVLLSSLF